LDFALKSAPFGGFECRLALVSSSMPRSRNEGMHRLWSRIPYRRLRRSDRPRYLFL